MPTHFLFEVYINLKENPIDRPSRTASFRLLTFGEKLDGSVADR